MSFIGLKQLIKTLYNALKQRILEKLRKKWEKIGIQLFDLNYVIYGNAIYETRLDKYADGSIHIIDSIKSI